MNELPKDIFDPMVRRGDIELVARALKANARLLRLKKPNAMVREAICGIEKRQ